MPRFPDLPGDGRAAGEAVGPIDWSSATTTCLPANIIDDGSGCG
jgi:hypothetical protein